MTGPLNGIFRKHHQQRAERLEARFSPTWTGDSPAPTETVLPDDPAQQTDPAPAKGKGNSPPPVATPPQPLPPPASTSTTVVAPIPTTSATTSVVVTTPVAAVVPTTPTSLLTTPTIDPSPTAQFTTLSGGTFRSLPSGTSTAAADATATPSSGMSTGSIVGIAAGSIAGVALVGALGVWVLKRWFNSRDHDGDADGAFNRNTWMRNSVALADDIPSPIARGRHSPGDMPRPPTMIERKRVQNYSNVGPSHGQYNQGEMAYHDYNDSPYPAPPMPSYNHGHPYNSQLPPQGQSFFSPIASPTGPPSPGMAFRDSAPQQTAYFSRHDSTLSAAQPDSAALPETPNMQASGDGYTPLDRAGVTPYQAQQGTIVSHQLDKPQPLPPTAEEETEEHAQSYSNYTHSHESPFADPPGPHDSLPPALPLMRTAPMDSAHPPAPSFAQLADAFPATPTSPAHPSTPPLSPGVGSQRGQVVTVSAMHAVRETPVQFGFTGSASGPAPAPAPAPAAHRPGRPDTLYSEEDAYGGI